MHTLLSLGITSPVLSRYLINNIAVALLFTMVLHIFTLGGREMGGHGKDQVLPQPDESIL